MTETFDHLFGGWKKAQARRWRNPDGSEGGIVAVDARLDQALVVPSDAVIWPGASIGYRASIGEGASIGYRASIGEGASIGDRASIGEGASIGDRASIGEGASIGYRASIGEGASIGSNDWWLSGGPCGSRNAFWTAVWSPEHGLRWWIGCQRGITTGRFVERLQDEHGDNDHAADYRAVIAFVEGHPGLARAKAKSAPAEKAA